MKITSNYNESPTKSKKRVTILMSAYRLFVEKGIQYVSMQEIAEYAGIQRRSLYNYYNDMEQIVLDIMKCQFNGIKSLDWNSTGKSAYEEVESIVTQIYNYLVRDPDFLVFSSYTDHYFGEGSTNIDFAQLITSHHAPDNFKALEEKCMSDNSINPIFSKQLSENMYLLLTSIYSLAQKIILQNMKIKNDAEYDCTAIKSYLELMLNLIKA